MPDPISLSALIIGGAIGGAAEVLVGKAADKTPNLVQRARSLFEFSQQVPAATVNAGIQAAVEAARQETLHRIKIGELKLDPQVADEMVVLLDHPTFAADVANQVLFGGLPDFDRLTAAYISQPRRAGAAGTHWDNLEEPLLDFFRAIKSHLQADPQFGYLVREVERLATLTRLDDRSLIIADATRQAVAVQERIAGSTAQTAFSLENLVQIASRQEQVGSRSEAQLAQQVVYLAGIRDLLAAVLRARGPEEIEPTPTAAGLLTEEITYLRLLQNKCNRLPLALASDTRATGARGGTQVELARVYVDLQTTSNSPWDLVFDRLGVPRAEREKAMRALRKLDQTAAKRGEREAVAEEMTLAHLGGRLDFDKHPLKAWARDEESLRAALQPMTALEALARHKRLVLLGKPGSGKSTLVNHLAFTLAGALLSSGADWRTVLQEAFAAPLFPMRVVLRSWSAKLQADSRAGVELVYAALTATIGLSDRKRLLAHLESPSTLILFDGLDEVPAGDGDAVDRRRLVIASVQAFCVAHPHCHVLVTSRVKPYREQQSIYQMPDLPVFELADLDTARIQRFTYRWYEELIRIEQLSAAQASEKSNLLLQAINRRRDLATMAGTPLLLTMLARVNARADLPDSRAELYDECVEQLLWEWEKGKVAGRR